MIRRKTLKRTWVSLLLLFFIVSIAYSNYSSQVYYSPDGEFDIAVGQTFFAFFVGGLLIILAMITVLLYFIHKDLDE